ncbi:MAG TPA: hypothetical protein VHH11_07770 [Gammaproteobacteria bacterium]|nr:hypothetical protein [Gammaproteobacteria bacterium]
MKTDPIASLQPIKQIDGTMIRLQRSGEHVLLCVRIGNRETSRQVDVHAAERFWMGVKGALPVTHAVEAMKMELLKSQDRARLAVVAQAPTNIIPS